MVRRGRIIEQHFKWADGPSYGTHYAHHHNPSLPVHFFDPHLQGTKMSSCPCGSSYIIRTQSALNINGDSYLHEPLPWNHHAVHQNKKNIFLGQLALLCWWRLREAVSPSPFRWYKQGLAGSLARNCDSVQMVIKMRASSCSSNSLGILWTI